MQQKELEAHLEELDRIKNDHVEATEAEAVAKQAEAAQAAEILRLEREAKGNKNKQSNDAWVRSSRYCNTSCIYIYLLIVCFYKISNERTCWICVNLIIIYLN